MNKIKLIFLISSVVFSSVLFSGCWNYHEVDELSVVAGVAIDTGRTHRYKLTAEIIQISGGKDTKQTPLLISMEGDTVFDAARNMISLSGKKLYWSHAKVIILSSAIAKKGIIKILDWYFRDSETRSDINVLISKEDTAQKILEGDKTTEEIRSFELYKSLGNNKNLSKSPDIRLDKLISSIQSDGKAAIAPAVWIKKTDHSLSPYIDGTAIFKGDKLVGFINGEDTKYMLFIQNKINGGVLVQNEKYEAENTPVSLEIFKNITKVKPIINRDILEGINIKIKTDTAIDEIQGSQNLIDDPGRSKLEKDADKTMQYRTQKLITKVQSEFGADIFGFGTKINESNPKLWKKISPSWDSQFRTLKVNVAASIHIRNSAMTSKTIESGE